MKKILITLCTLHLALCTLWAQIPVLRVETNSETAQFQVTDIDSIAFSPNADYLYVNYSGDKQRAFVSADVQQLSYGTVSAAENIAIVWNADGTVNITNPMSADGVSVTANGGDVLIESTYPGEVNYNLSGQSTNGSLKLYSDYKYQLTLLGLTLTKNGTNSIYSGSSAPTSTTDAWDGYIYLGGTSGTTSVKTFTGK